MDPIPPDDWSPRQALAVLDFIEALHRAIWERYEAVIVPLYIEQLHEPSGMETQPEFDDDIPF